MKISNGVSSSPLDFDMVFLIDPLLALDACS